MQGGSKRHCSVVAVPPFLSQEASIYREDSDDDWEDGSDFTFPSHVLLVALEASNAYVHFIPIMKEFCTLVPLPSNIELYFCRTSSLT